MSAVLKTCNRCSQPLPLTAFHASKRLAHGVASRCKPCTSEDKRARYAADPEARREYARTWRLQNAESERARHRADYYRNQPAKVAKASRWNKANRERRAAAERERRKNPIHALHGRISAGIRTRMRRGKGGASTEDLLGYSLAELAAHLERQFLKGMSWENMGEWHVDHIVPLTAFNITGPDDPELRRAWALPNLRPLWAADNVAKSDKRVTLL